MAQVPKEATFLQLKEAASEASGIPAANQKCEALAIPPKHEEGMIKWSPSRRN